MAKKSLGLSMAIALVIAAGVAMFTMYFSAFESLDHTHTTYYDRYRFADVFASLKRAPLATVSRIEALPGVARVPIKRKKVSLVRGSAVTAEPLAAWRAGDLYLTAVKLTNRTGRALTLDPRTLRGDWLSAAFQHNRLLPKGDESDTTALYLISARPFEASL